MLSSWDKGLQIMPEEAARAWELLELCFGKRRWRLEEEAPRGGTSRGSRMRVLIQPEPGCSRVTFAKRSLLWKKKSICVEQASS